MPTETAADPAGLTEMAPEVAEPPEPPPPPTDWMMIPGEKLSAVLMFPAMVPVAVPADPPDEPLPPTATPTEIAGDADALTELRPAPPPPPMLLMLTPGENCPNVEMVPL